MFRQRTLRVENVTRGTTVVEKGRIADNFWMRLKGLLGVRRLAFGNGLLITPNQQVHTHFMAFPIDVLYVDKDDVVVDVDACLKPWRIGRSRAQARYVIEAPAGVIARTGTGVGDSLRVMFILV